MNLHQFSIHDQVENRKFAFTQHTTHNRARGRDTRWHPRDNGAPYSACSPPWNISPERTTYQGACGGLPGTAAGMWRSVAKLPSAPHRDRRWRVHPPPVPVGLPIGLPHAGCRMRVAAWGAAYCCTEGSEESTSRNSVRVYVTYCRVLLMSLGSIEIRHSLNSLPRNECATSTCTFRSSPTDLPVTEPPVTIQDTG